MTGLSSTLPPAIELDSVRTPLDHHLSQTHDQPPTILAVNPVAPYRSTNHHKSSTSFTTSRETQNILAENSHSRNNRLSLAAIARDKTVNAFTNFSLRPKTSFQSLHSSSSSGSLSKQRSPTSVALTSDPSSTKLDQATVSPNRHPSRSHQRLPTSLDLNHISATDDQPRNAIPALVNTGLTATVRRSSPPPSYTESRVKQNQEPSHSQGSDNKMHQTSSRLLRMTDEERPFTRDFEDLFSTLMVSLPLSSHRIRFQKVEHTFTSEEAINNLGSLKFSQSNRMPDPKDPTRIVTTTTTTTFSMAKEMARSVCQRFMDARFCETADGKPIPSFPLKNAVWQLTPKGMHVLTRFCQRNGINQRHVVDVLDSARNTMQLVILERDGTTDKLSHDRATMEVIFRRFAGQEGPNIKTNISTSDSDSLSDYYNGLIGVKMAKERKILERTVTNTFTGKATVDWLMDCCTTVDRREVFEIAELFVQHGLIWAVVEDKVYMHQHPGTARFQPTKNSIYGLTEKGQRVAGWIPRGESPSGDENRGDSSAKGGNGNSNGRKEGRNIPKDSNNNRLMMIVNDPALRLLFREYLRDTHCEENLAFYLEVREFTRSYDSAERAKAFTRLDAIRESLAAAYGLYNAFLAPGSPCELNIDHNLRNSLAGRMTRAVGDDDSMLKSLQEVVGLFKEAQGSVFKLMSSDSVPKFLKEPKYAAVLSQHNFDHPNHHQSSQSTLPERTRSTAIREDRTLSPSSGRVPSPAATRGPSPGSRGISR